MTECSLHVCEEDVADGLREGYPACCVWWFTFVWAPVCRWLMTSGYGDAESLRYAKQMFRGSTAAGYVQCPRCRRSSQAETGRCAM